MKTEIIKNKYKLAIDRAIKGNTTGQDVTNIIRFQNKELVGLKGEELNQYEINLLTAYSIAFN